MAREHPAFLVHERGIAAAPAAATLSASSQRCPCVRRPARPGAGSGELERGEIVALLGPNGSGKTTLAKLTRGCSRPSEGGASAAGGPRISSQDPGRYVVAERVDEEVSLGVGGDLERARAALALVGLEGFDARHPRDLSSGERERLGLAAVLVTEPELLVLDEPTRGMDPERKLELAALLVRRARSARRSSSPTTSSSRRKSPAEVADST